MACDVMRCLMGKDKGHLVIILYIGNHRHRHHDHGPVAVVA